MASSIRYLEETAVHTRRGHNGVETIKGTGLVAASFRHYRNRNDDPHLHDHVLVPNMVQGDDGRWSTLDARHLYAHAKTAGYIYQAVLREQLTRTLGVEFGPVTNGVASIEGIPRRAIDAFSTRRAEILEHLDTIGASSARAAQIATLQTRRAKEQQPDLDAIQAEWRTRAVANGLEIERLDAVLGRVRADGLSEQQRTAAAARMLSPDGLTGHASTFDRRDLLRGAAMSSPPQKPDSKHISSRRVTSIRANSSLPRPHHHHHQQRRRRSTSNARNGANSAHADSHMPMTPGYLAPHVAPQALPRRTTDRHCLGLVLW